MAIRKELVAGLLVCLAASPLLQLTSAKAAQDGAAQSQHVAIASAPDALVIPTNHVDVSGNAGQNAGAGVLLDPTGRPQASPFVLSSPRAVPPFPIQLNQYVLRYLSDFQQSPDGLQDSFDRSRPYLGAMVKVLRSYGVPEDMVYLAFAESAFSGGQTKGIWQFNATTARRFGLHVDSWVDERRDPVLSTRAAAEYLATLHDVAGSDWRMAVVGWNNGDNAIDRYWSLRGVDFERLMNRVPKRTRALLGRFMAVAYIAHHAATYGLSLVSYDAAPVFREIRVRGGIALDVLAIEYGTSVERIRAMNPALQRDWVPPWAGAYNIRIPLETHAAADTHPTY
jgi:membrane-bound lytic murein transglycosylase D